MTRRRSLADLERDLESLEDAVDGERDGFYYVQIGGEPDPDAGGYYAWNDDRGAYVNAAGHELPAEQRGLGTVFHGDGAGDDADGAAIREALSGIPDNEA